MTIDTIIARSELTITGLFTPAEIDRLFVYRAAVDAGYFTDHMDTPEPTDDMDGSTYHGI